jgi:hypothetical protein
LFFLLGAQLATGCSKTDIPVTTVQKRDVPVIAPSGPPRAELKRAELDAGELDFSVPSDCKFPVRNSGGQPLTLTFVAKSCFCTDATVPPDPIPPGGEGVVVVRWTPIPGKTGPERIKAEIATNDPDKPTIKLEVTGVINPLIRIAPENESFIDFNRLEPGAVKSRELKVFSTKLEAFDLDAKLDLPGIKLKKRKLDLDSSSRIGDAQPACAYALLLETTPSLPPGYFMTDLVLTLKAPDAAAREVRMRVYGEVANGLFKVLPNQVEFTAPRLADGDQRRVLVQFIDPAKKQSLKIAKVEPGFVQCDEPKAIPGASGLWEFIARIPPKNAEAMKLQPDGFFEGRIVLEASGSQAHIPVRVKWNPSKSGVRN